jgi:hypothetical protein
MNMSEEIQVLGILPSEKDGPLLIVEEVHYVPILTEALTFLATEPR